jgi:hypothetical protein
MPALPKSVRERLASEFRFAATKIGEAPEISGKVYYFSVFYGEATRQLNMHWDADLALLWSVTQTACLTINTRLATTPVYLGIPDGFLQAMDEVSNELAAAFEGEDVDVPRLCAALARVAELTYVVTGNGAYLHQKGMIRF